MKQSVNKCRKINFTKILEVNSFAFAYRLFHLISEFFCALLYLLLDYINTGLLLMSS